MTQPKLGWGDVKPADLSASSAARRMCTASSAWEQRKLLFLLLLLLRVVAAAGVGPQETLLGGEDKAIRI